MAGIKNPQPKEIYLIEAVWGMCHDKRPCIILEPAEQEYVKVAYISSAIENFCDLIDFKIDSQDSDFQATGLRRTSFVSGKSFQTVKTSRLNKYLGKLIGDLAKRFDLWYG